jgi:hypothetical protein
MMDTLLKNWHFVRWLRLGLGVFLIYQAVAGKDQMMGFFGAFLLFQAATNTGCGPSGCTPPMTNDKNDDAPIEPEFEIIKPK